MLRFRKRFGIAALIAGLIPAISAAQAPARIQALDPEGIQSLQAETGGAARISVSNATGAARFVRLPAESKRSLSPMGAAAAPAEKTSAFLHAHGKIFGISAPDSELALLKAASDSTGGNHLTYQQIYFGVPVFAGELKSHFDSAGRLTAINGTFVPSIAVDTTPSTTELAAGKAAIAAVESELEASLAVSVLGTKLYVYRTGLAQGVPGNNYLAWEVEVGDGASVREFVYVDAHTNKIVDRLPGIIDGMYRRAYNGRLLNGVPPEYPNTPYWVEGDPFPTASTEANNMLLASQETYDFYNHAFGRDSIDGAGAIMDSIFDRGYSCPNASWNGTFISFCRGMTTDDVTAHEWTHAYTQYTHNLIYAWQPGALNEAYSDIFGETVDLINNRMTDTPGGNRAADGSLCSTYDSYPPVVRVNSPASIAGNYGAGPALFGPALTPAGITGDIVLALDAGPATTDACTALTNAAEVAGKIAFIDRGTCGFKLKVYNAQQAGAIGVIIANISTSANALVNMADDPTVPTITIPATNVLFSTGNTIRSQFGVGVNATLRKNAPAVTEDSVRWLMGEDDTATGLVGPLRDMWRPVCHGNPGKVSDSDYGCSTADQGGVHDNSGVPNHAYALLVDGGTYNGQTVTGIGLTKAAHIYFRAMAIYQVQTSDFPDHADALEQACADLIGQNLNDLVTGAPSGQIITSGDCAQLPIAAASVEMRTPPAQCNFQPLLAKNPPAQCEVRNFYTADFESGDAGYSVAHTEVSASFTDREWERVSSLPDGRAGSAFFAIDPQIGTCTASGDESGVLHLTSPPIAVPANLSTPVLTFNHYLTSEPGFDGGNLKIKVDSGDWTLVPKADYTYNSYNTTLAAAPGNTDPLAGQPAFSGTDGGTVEGSWGQSQIRLASGLAGHTVQLRWDFGTDGCGGALYGWFVDDVKFYDRNFSTQVSIAGCNTGVPNSGLATGCTISDLLSECAENAATHELYTACVTQTTNTLKRDGVINNKQKNDIQQCAARARIP